MCRTLATIGHRLGYDVQLEMHVGRMREQGQAAPINGVAAPPAGAAQQPPAPGDLRRLDVNFVVPPEGPLYDGDIPNQVIAVDVTITSEISHSAIERMKSFERQGAAARHAERRKNLKYKRLVEGDDNLHPNGEPYRFVAAAFESGGTVGQGVAELVAFFRRRVTLQAAAVGHEQYYQLSAASIFTTATWRTLSVQFQQLQHRFVSKCASRDRLRLGLGFAEPPQPLELELVPGFMGLGDEVDDAASVPDQGPGAGVAPVGQDGEGGLLGLGGEGVDGLDGEGGGEGEADGGGFVGDG